MNYACSEVKFESPLAIKAKQLNLRTMALRQVYGDLRKSTREAFSPQFDCPECEKHFKAEVANLEMIFARGLK